MARLLHRLRVLPRNRIGARVRPGCLTGSSRRALSAPSLQFARACPCSLHYYWNSQTHSCSGVRLCGPGVNPFRFGVRRFVTRELISWLRVCDRAFDAPPGARLAYLAIAFQLAGWLEAAAENGLNYHPMMVAQLPAALPEV